MERKMKLDTPEDCEKELNRLFKKLFGNNDRVKPESLEIKGELYEHSPTMWKEANLINLEKDILENGIYRPLVMWNMILLDGWKRYEIAIKHKLPFKCVWKDFKTLYDAEMWTIDQKIKNDNLCDWNLFILATWRWDIEEFFEMKSKLGLAVPKIVYMSKADIDKLPQENLLKEIFGMKK